MLNAKQTWGKTQYEIVLEFTKFIIYVLFRQDLKQIPVKSKCTDFYRFLFSLALFEKMRWYFLFPCQITMFHFRFCHLRDTFSNFQGKSRFHRIVYSIVHRYIEQQSKAPTCSFIFGPKCTNFIGICAIFHSKGQFISE